MNKIIIIIILLLIIGISCSNQRSIDPYEIIDNLFEQTSDLKMDDRSYHFFGYRHINALYNFCSIEMWSYKKLSRIEELCDDKEFIIISNDTITWSIRDGEIEIDTSAYNLKISEVEHLMRQRDSFKRDSNIFQLKFLGYENVTNESCYVIEVRHIDSDIKYTLFLDTLNLLLVKKINNNSQLKIDQYFSQYKNVKGEFMAFRKVLFFNNRPDSFVIIYDSIKINESFNDSLFNFTN